MATFRLRVNDRTRVITIDDPDTPLLYVLRNDLDLTGTRFGCGLAQCGACTVHVDGRAVRSCITPVRRGAGQARDDHRGARLARAARSRSRRRSSPSRPRSAATARRAW